MTLHQFGFVTMLGILATSALCYRHAGRPYARGKSEAIPTTPSFRWVYRIIQVTMLYVALGWGLGWPGTASIEMPTVITASGIALSLAGLALFIWAKRSLGEHYSPC